MIDAVISVVMTGRRMQSSESVIGYAPAFLVRASTRVPSDSSNCPSTTTLSPPGEPFRDHRHALRGAVDLDRLDLGGAVLDHEDEIAALAALHGDRRHHDRVLLRMMSLVATSVPGHNVSFSLFMMPRTVTMPVV
jgi:hypothetical protein